MASTLPFSLWTCILVCSFLMVLAPTRAHGQHFTDCLATTSNATILVPREASSSLGTAKAPLSPGDEIAVFTEEGTCVGVGRWSGDNLAIAVAGINSQETEGYEPGEAFKFRVWDASADATYRPKVAYEACSDYNPICQDDGRYQDDMVYTLSRISASGEDDLLELTLQLKGNAPNPFRQRTTIHFETSTSAQVTLTVYNVLGQKIATLVDRKLSAGPHAIAWDGRARNGAAIRSGVYLYRIQADDRTQTGRMTVVR